jgi:hypothetical protein
MTATERHVLTDESNRILDYLAAMPKYGRTTTTREVVRNMLIGTDGWIMSKGHQWDIQSKSRGAGIYEVWLEKRL